MSVARWVGREKLRAKFLALPAKARALVDQALDQGADEIMAMQKRAAPRDDGDLARSIKKKRTSRSQSLVATKITAGDETGKPPTKTYARLVEFGVAPHIAGGRFKGAQHPGAKAQPFFFPPYRALRKRVKARIRRAIKKAVQSK